MFARQMPRHPVGLLGLGIVRRGVALSREYLLRTPDRQPRYLVRRTLSGLSRARPFLTFRQPSLLRRNVARLQQTHGRPALRSERIGPDNSQQEGTTHSFHNHMLQLQPNALFVFHFCLYCFLNGLRFVRQVFRLTGRVAAEPF